MKAKKTILTYAGLKKLEDELQDLKVVQRKDDVHIKHMDYMETEEFKKLYAERYINYTKNRRFYRRRRMVRKRKIFL